MFKALLSSTMLFSQFPAKDLSSTESNGLVKDMAVFEYKA